MLSDDTWLGDESLTSTVHWWSLAAARPCVGKPLESNFLFHYHSLDVMEAAVSPSLCLAACLNGQRLPLSLLPWRTLWARNAVQSKSGRGSSLHHQPQEMMRATGILAVTSLQLSAFIFTTVGKQSGELIR